MLSPHWAAILAALDSLLEVLQAAHVPRFLVKKLFQQVSPRLFQLELRFILPLPPFKT